jgi:hypothetical protein
LALEITVFETVPRGGAVEFSPNRVNHHVFGYTGGTEKQYTAGHPGRICHRSGGQHDERRVSDVRTFVRVGSAQPPLHVRDWA